MDDLQLKLKRIQGRSKKDKEETIRLQFDTRLGRLRKLRKDFRDLERKALDERIHYLNSMLQQKQEQERLRHKLQRLKAIPEENFIYPRKSIFDFTAFILILFQVAWIVLMGLVVEYREDTADNNGYNTRIDDWYSFYTQIALQVFFAWGMSGLWLRKYAFGSLLFSFMIGVYALQWGFLLNGFFDEVSRSQYGVLDLTIHKLILALVCSTALVVSHGAVLGKVGIFGGEIFFYTLAGVAVWTLNYFICILVLKASDVGGAMTVHLWGGLYGIGATTCLSRYWDRRDPTYTSDQHPEHTSNYLSDVMAMVGTIFLWILFPAWNAALAPDTSQHRVAINTFLGLTASAVVGYLFSRIVRSKYVEIRDIQSVIFAGGIALGSGHSLVIKPAAALIIGAVAALSALIADVFLHNHWEKRRPHNRLRVFDTKHVFAFHVIPGLIGGIASIVAAVINSQVQYGVDVTENYFRRGFPRQGGFQAACLFISIATAVLSGYLVGFILNVLRGKITKKTPGPYLDEHAFVIPYDYPKPAYLYGGWTDTAVSGTNPPTRAAATAAPPAAPANTPPQ
eukprot:TRINITY_DN1787_c0_g1_i1.p1 TRINITY_DN1787_c0_g1~~TRINITY_DN1787_c0_g1_i1.p1  ORF type:complete len:651 (-),score=97.28 TRINITY_DN1787_c0_g1_i1:245-1942(-)